MRWSFVVGTLDLVLCTWFLVLGTLYLVLCTWYWLLSTGYSFFLRLSVVNAYISYPISIHHSILSFFHSSILPSFPYVKKQVSTMHHNGCALRIWQWSGVNAGRAPVSGRL